MALESKTLFWIRFALLTPVCMTPPLVFGFWGLGSMFEEWLGQEGLDRLILGWWFAFLGGLILLMLDLWARRRSLAWKGQWTGLILFPVTMPFALPMYWLSYIAGIKKGHRPGTEEEEPSDWV